MAKRIPEEKLIEHIAEALDNNWFNPVIAANLLVNHYPLYTQDRVIDLIGEIVRQQAERFKQEWEHGQTSEGLMLADHLNDVYQFHAYGVEVNP